MKKSKSNIILIISICLFILAVLTFTIFTIINNNEINKATSFYSEKDVDKTVKLDVQLMLDYFASSEDENSIKAHIVFDEKSIPYVVVLDKKNEKKLKSILDYTYSENEGPMIEPITIYGKTAYINDELKKLAISYYNNFLKEEIVNEDNFESYFGVYYLDTTQNPNQTLMLGSILSISALIGGGICLFIYFKSKKGKKKAKKK